MGRSKGYGAPIGRRNDRRRNDISRPLPSRADGIYPGTGSGWGEFGSTRYPTVLEAYNRDSDYRRWKMGLEYWFGVGKTWNDYQLPIIARLASGPVDNAVRLVTTLFPSTTSSEKAWHVTCKVRGSVIVPTALDESRISYEVEAADPSEHRLVYNAQGVLSFGQLRQWETLVGDQFEDSASGASYPDDLIGKPVGAVALTLTEVDAANALLRFDLSRPFSRILIGRNVAWKQLDYDPAEPTIWTLDGTRHLCSSFKFVCSCPDYQGRAVANLNSASGSLRDRFPMPNAARTPSTDWETRAAGYYKQWRTLSQRSDRRRECKHIHATRWDCGVPFAEPGDYPVGGERSWVDEQAFRERDLTFDQVMAYQAQRLTGYDRLLPAVAQTIGLNLDPTGDLRGNDELFRPADQPILWNDQTEPLYNWARAGDWWLKRGTNEVRAFFAADGGFNDTINGEPIFEVLSEGAATAPVIVR